LKQLEELAVPALRFAIDKETPSIESRRRIERLLADHEDAGLALGPLRELRALAALERIGTLEACELLTVIAKGAPAARLTQDAQESLDRIAKPQRQQARAGRLHSCGRA